MSMKLAADCWDCVLSHSERTVLTALCDEANDEGQRCYPGIPYLVWKTDYDERSIRRILRGLEDAGYIEVVAPAAGPGSFTEYAIHLDRVPRKEPWRKVKARLMSEQRGGKMSALKQPRGGIPSRKGGHSIPKGGAFSTARGGIPSTETGALPDAIAENTIRPVVNPVNDPKVNPTDENNARPPLREIRPVLRPRELEAAAQADSPSWAALVREADSLPVLGAEHERWTATWRGLQDWAARAGLDDDALAAEIHARARRYHRQFTTPYTTPALGANWAALAHDPPPRPEGAPARASPGDAEALIAAQPKLTRANIEAGRRFLERRGHGLRGIPGLPDPAGGRDEQVPERRADRAVVADVRALPPGDVRDGGQSSGG